MTTETAPDPTTEAWSDRLEEQLVEAGMEQQPARAYRLAFELGLTRVISQTATRQEFKDLGDRMQELATRDELAATRQELKDEIAGLRAELKETATRAELAATRQELKDEIAGLRSEMRFLFLLFGGLMTALLAAILAIVA